MKVDYLAMFVTLAFIGVALLSPVLWGIGLGVAFIQGNALHLGLAIGFPPFGVVRGAMYLIDLVQPQSIMSAVPNV